MQISELVDQLESIESAYGDLEVRATCDGFLPPEIEIKAQPDRDMVVLNGSRMDKLDNVQGKMQSTSGGNDTKTAPSTVNKMSGGDRGRALLPPIQLWFYIALVVGGVWLLWELIV